MRVFYTLTAAGLLLTQTIDISSASEGHQSPPPTVVVEHAAPASGKVVRRYVGAVEAINSVRIMPRITGELKKVNFTEGGLVKAGQLLYELEDTTYQAAVQALEAQLEAQKATLEFATKEYVRKYKLLKSNVVSTAAHEQALMEINVAKANIKRLEASLLDARNTLSYTRITAPISGRISKSIATVGNLITPQSGAMTDIQQLAPIYVKFSISEKTLRRDFGGAEKVPAIARVRAMLADNTLAGETARVTLVDNKINAQSNTITMYATFPNRKFDLLPGSYVTVLLSAENANAALPSVLPSAIVMENDQCYIWVLDKKSNMPAKRKVKIGETVAGRTIVLEGIKNGELIVVDGTHKIRPNTPVAPIDAKKVFKQGK